LNEEDFTRGCNSEDSELERMQEEDIDGYLLVPFIKLARQFDHYTETLLNLKMCTSTCPCYYEESHMETIDGV